MFDILTVSFDIFKQKFEILLKEKCLIYRLISIFGTCERKQSLDLNRV